MAAVILTLTHLPHAEDPRLTAELSRALGEILCTHLIALGHVCPELG